VAEVEGAADGVIAVELAGADGVIAADPDGEAVAPPQPAIAMASTIDANARRRRAGVLIAPRWYARGYGVMR
jgi:hypothetical protein